MVTYHRVIPSPSIAMLPHRTTFSLDQATVDGIRELAKIWDTTQAGAVRRAIEEAVQTHAGPLSVSEAIAGYQLGLVPRSSEQLAALTRAQRADRVEESARREERAGLPEKA